MGPGGGALGLAALARLPGGRGGKAIALLKKFAGDGKGGIDFSKLGPLLALRGKGGGAGLLASLGQGAGATSPSSGTKTDTRGMLLLAAVMGMAAASKPSDSSSSDIALPEGNIYS